MEDPKLAALGWGGGVTRTHMLLEGSPAIGAGDNSMNRTNEQRGLGYSRTSPPNATVDIGAVQFEDRIFRDGLDDFYL
jgi:hypothetical protein